MDDAHDSESAKTEPPIDPDGAEGKRQRARRRFLKGTAAGSGAFIVTFHHRRANAKKIMTSSAAVCASLNGVPGKTTQVKDVTNPNGPMVTVVECKLPK